MTLSPKAHVNLAARDDLIGDVARQKARLDRVSEVLCDGMTDAPSDVWRGWSNLVRAEGLDVLADRLGAVADLIESENL